MLSDEQVEIIKSGGVGVIPTGSVYGLMSSAMVEVGIEKVYKLKRRNPTKPSIVLVSSPEDLSTFGVDTYQISLAKGYWPGMTSVILDVPNSVVPKWLHRGTNSLAFRVPPDEELRKVLALTGPMIAPSANPEGDPPSTTIDEAKAYFGDKVDFYVDGGVCDHKPSKVIKLGFDQIETIRE